MVPPRPATIRWRSSPNSPGTCATPTRCSPGSGRTPRSCTSSWARVRHPVPARREGAADYVPVHRHQPRARAASAHRQRAVLLGRQRDDHRAGHGPDHPGDGRARAPAPPRPGGEGLPHPGAGPVERCDHRRHRERADRRLRRRRPRRPHPAADLPVPGPGHRPDPRPARGRLAPLPAAVDPADRGHAELGGRSRGEPGAARLLRRDHRRPAAAHPRRPGEPADLG